MRPPPSRPTPGRRVHRAALAVNLVMLVLCAGGAVYLLALGPPARGHLLSAAVAFAVLGLGTGASIGEARIVWRELRARRR